MPKIETGGSSLSPRLLSRTVSLEPLSWRIFIDGTSPHHLGSQRIEIKCRWLGDLDDGIDVHGRGLDAFVIALEVQRCDQAWLDGSIAKQRATFAEDNSSENAPYMGKLYFWSDKISNEPITIGKILREAFEKPQITGWVAFGEDYYDRIQDQLLGKSTEFKIGLKIKFDEVELSGDDLHHRWTGRELDVLGSKIVFQNDTSQENEPEFDDDDLGETETMPENSESKLFQARVLNALNKVLIPIWLIAAVAIVSIFL